MTFLEPFISLRSEEDTKTPPSDSTALLKGHTRQGFEKGIDNPSPPKATWKSCWEAHDAECSSSASQIPRLKKKPDINAFPVKTHEISLNHAHPRISGGLGDPAHYRIKNTEYTETPGNISAPFYYKITGSGTYCTRLVKNIVINRIRLDKWIHN